MTMNGKDFSTTEIQQLREATKGTATQIHFNNAGSSLPPDVVVDAIISYLTEEAACGGYETEAKYRGQLDHTNALVARLINAHADEIALTENASAAWDVAFNGLAFKRGDEVIVSEMEYASNVLGLLNAERLYGIAIKMIPNDQAGNFSLEALEGAITSRTKLIAVTHIPSTAGNILPVAEIGRIAREHQITYLLDACQSVGQLPVDVRAIGCDMLAVTGRKYLRGPRGSGFLYVRKPVQDQLRMMWMDGHSVSSMNQDGFTPRNDARRFQWYEKNFGVIMGFHKALEYLLNLGVERTWTRIQHLATVLRKRLGGMEGIAVHDQGNDLCGIVTFSVLDVPAATVKEWLSTKRINVSIGFVNATLYYMNRKSLNGIIRASLHYYNTEEEIDEFCRVVGSVKRQRQQS